MNFWDFFFLILVIAPVVYRVARNGGLKGAVFNAPVARAISELDLRRGGTRTKLQVYLLDPRDPVRGPHIGIALRSSTASAWAIRSLLTRGDQSLTLTRDQARQLAEVLAQAAAD